MSPAGIEVEVLLADLLASSGQGRLSVPFGAPGDAAEVRGFGAFGITRPGDSFSLGWSLSVTESSAARYAVAFVTGAIVYQPGTFGAPGTLALTNADALGSFIRQSDLPDWFPFPDYVVYQNIDESQTDLLLREYLEQNPSATDAIYAATGLTSVDQVISAFIAGTLTSGIPVPAGQPIGVAATSGSGTRRLDISMQTESGVADGLYLDPAVYHLHLSDYFQDLDGHVLIDTLRKVFGGPVANGVVRYVKAGGGKTGDFTNPAAPADLVSTALSVCQAYDTIVIVDGGRYQEAGELKITQPITVTSLDTTRAIETTSPTFPQLVGSSEDRVIRIDSVDGIVSLSSLTVTGGTAKNDASFPLSGGGILIYQSDQTYVRNCFITQNVTGLGLADENGYGGGIHAFEASAYIYGNRISDNVAAYRGGGIGIWAYGWPVIEGNVIEKNQANSGWQPPDGLVFGDGGGIGVNLAVKTATFMDPIHPERMWDPDKLATAMTRRIIVKQNQINENSAEDDGGGIYLSVLAQAKLSNNQITSNVAKNAGGGLRATLGSSVNMSGDKVNNNRGNLDHGSNGGGGIASRDASLWLSNVEIQENTIEGYAGGGIFFSATDEGTPSSPIPVNIGLDYNTVLREVFGVSEVNLVILGATFITNNHCTLIEGGTDHRKGGGAYLLRYQGLDSQGNPFEALPLTVLIEKFSGLTDNHVDEVTGVVGTYTDPSGVTYPNAKNFNLDDLVGRPNSPVDDSNAANYMAGDQFEYPGTSNP